MRTVHEAGLRSLPEQPSFYPVLNGGELAVLYSFVFLYLVFAGPGPWSLDALRGRERTDALPAGHHAGTR